MRLPRWKELVWAELASPRRLDLLIAAGLLAWGLPDVPWWWEYPGHAGSTPDVLGSLALTLAMSVPFCWRRRFPVPVLGLALGVLATRTLLHRNDFSAFAAVLVACYGLGAYSGATRRYARWLGWLALAAAVIAVFTSNGNRVNGLPFALLAAALVLGDAASARRAEAAAAVEAAHQAERTRIARELHDVVAHQLSAIAVQAGAARLAARSQPYGHAAGSQPDSAQPDSAQPDSAQPSNGQPSNGQPSNGQPGNGQPGQGTQPGKGAQPASPGQPESPAQVLATVERLAREALAELNHLLGALRREPADDPTRPPAPTLAELNALLATSRADGVPADLIIEGASHTLSPGVELSCYRIIAEALANVARHAPGAPTRVTLRFQPLAVEIEVANAPSPRAHRQIIHPGSGGRGVRGMRERAELYGGSLAARARPDGGFVVTAQIPCHDPVTGHSPAGHPSPARHPSPASQNGSANQDGPASQNGSANQDGPASQNVPVTAPGRSPAGRRA
jgi:signal transduction histidine kinase